MQREVLKETSRGMRSLGAEPQGRGTCKGRARRWQCLQRYRGSQEASGIPLAEAPGTSPRAGPLQGLVVETAREEGTCVGRARMGF